ncbi:MAG: hypothetical protein WD595_02385 [Waddliaceae bacterium]
MANIPPFSGSKWELSSASATPSGSASGFFSDELTPRIDHLYQQIQSSAPLPSSVRSSPSFSSLRLDVSDDENVSPMVSPIVFSGDDESQFASPISGLSIKTRDLGRRILSSNLNTVPNVLLGYESTAIDHVKQLLYKQADTLCEPNPEILSDEEKELINIRYDSMKAVGSGNTKPKFLVKSDFEEGKQIGSSVRVAIVKPLTSLNKDQKNAIKMIVQRNIESIRSSIDSDAKIVDVIEKSGIHQELGTYSGINESDLAIREIIAYLIGKDLGVPTTVVRMVEHELKTCQKFIQNIGTGRKVGEIFPDKLGTKQDTDLISFQKMAVLDALLYNRDRNPGNYLITEIKVGEDLKYGFVPIDHGNTLPKGLPFDPKEHHWEKWEVASEPISPEIRGIIDKITWKSVSKSLQKYPNIDKATKAALCFQLHLIKALFASNDKITAQQLVDESSRFLAPKDGRKESIESQLKAFEENEDDFVEKISLYISEDLK